MLIEKAIKCVSFANNKLTAMLKMKMSIETRSAARRPRLRRAENSMSNIEKALEFIILLKYTIIAAIHGIKK